MIEVYYKDVLNKKINLKKLLFEDVVVIRNAKPIIELREFIISSLPKNYQKELIDLYENKKLPSNEAVFHLRNALLYIRDNKVLSTYLYDFVKSIGFDEDILVDGGVNRLLFPITKYKELESDTLFNKRDFVRKRPASDVETFMNGVTNIHRDYNRKHSVEMFNCWIPMHRMNEKEILRIYPKFFKSQLLDMDNTEENLNNLGEYEKFNLNVGDFIMFHSEQVHVSPKRDINKTFRHSFDFRIITKEKSDGGHYRENFDNLNNFQNVNGETKYSLFNKYKNKELSFKEIFKLLKKFPFSEDIYIKIALLEIETPKNVKKIIKYVKKHTDKYFWIYKLYKLSVYIQDKKLSKKLYKKALKLAFNSKLDFSHNVVEYKNQHNEIDYEFIKNKEEKQYKNLIIISKDYIDNLDEKLSSVEDSLIIAPIELEKHLTYSKKHNLVVCFNNLSEKILKKMYKINHKIENIYVIPSKNDNENVEIYSFLAKTQKKIYLIDEKNRKKKFFLNKQNIISFLSEFKKNLKIGTNVKIYNYVTIDNNVTLMNNIGIGKGTSISTHVHIYNDCSIGKFCAIGSHCIIAAPPHFINTFSISNKIKYKNSTKMLNSTKIGNDVWIGANSTILANVKIGDGCIIGANSLVNKDIPPYSIAFGTPIKIYKKRFSNDIIAKLLKLQWWDIPYIEEYKIDFNIEKAISDIMKIKE